ncbi:MAG: pyridoxamine 5'-phosphate oxidase family protein, partial [Mariprofundus sp.]|nr:pyridoxamine 5'-phosphate oxidase family protein [Mariprofundus sp.]
MFPRPLATLGEHGPETTMAPFAIYQGNLLFHLSTLARHTTNIERDGNIGVMICSPLIEGCSALALPRLSLQGAVTALPNDQLIMAKQAYLAAIPDAEALFSFADFRLYQFTPAYIHWIGGFGKARKLTYDQWLRAAEKIKYPGYAQDRSLDSRRQIKRI